MVRYDRICRYRLFKSILGKANSTLLIFFYSTLLTIFLFNSQLGTGQMKSDGSARKTDPKRQKVKQDDGWANPY